MCEKDTLCQAERAEKARSAFEVLFAQPDDSGKLILPGSGLLLQISILLQSSVNRERSEGRAGAADCLNALIRLNGAKNFTSDLAAELFNAFTAMHVLPETLSAQTSTDAEFLLKQSLVFLDFLRSIPAGLPASEIERTLPGALDLFAELPENKSDLIALLLANDPFASHRVFGYRNGRFVPVEPDSIKPVNRFFGFPGIRQAYSEHFAAFVAGKTNLPLLVNSLPGYGKTSMTLSFAAATPGLVTILPEPEALEENWRTLTSQLALRSDHRFILFFDDIDPNKVDWYSFRTNVGGAFAPPENVMPVISANYEFPPSILSRGRKITYPTFDELRCSEMIEDFLRSFGMRNPPGNLVSLIGADYTEEFGQKHFTELSPRTLMRYLKIYETDQNKRRIMMELAGGEMITRPDAELFYEFNIELMRSLYGEEYIKRLLKERLKEL